MITRAPALLDRATTTNQRMDGHERAGWNPRDRGETTRKKQGKTAKAAASIAFLCAGAVREVAGKSRNLAEPNRQGV